MESEVTLPASFFPLETQELLWLHPLDLDFNEVLSRLKTKEYERLLLDPEEGFRSVRGLPQVSQDCSEENAEQSQISQFCLLVSSLDFEVEGRQSASMLAIMKTVQSLYFLGKITRLISQKQLQAASAIAKPSGSSQIVPAAV